jgi:hypothetical protein
MLSVASLCSVSGEVEHNYFVQSLRNCAALESAASSNKYLNMCCHKLSQMQQILLQQLLHEVTCDQSQYILAAVWWDTLALVWW